MNRREFLNKGALLFSASLFGSRLLAAEKTNVTQTEYVFNIITDRADLAIKKFDQFLRHNPALGRNWRFEECLLPGHHLTDLVMTENRSLVKFRENNGRIAAQLQDFSKALGLLRKAENPALLKFSAANGTERPETVQVFRNNLLLQEVDVRNDHRGITVPGVKGEIIFSVNKQTVRIEKAACTHKTCMQMGSITQAGQSLVCVPNQVNITIKGARPHGVDGITF